MTIQATVAVEADTPAAARSILQAAGFKVVRIAKPKTPPVTERAEGIRVSARTDMPAGLDHHERQAYVRGYAKGCTAWIKKNGSPAVQHKPGEAVDVAALRSRTIDHEWDRHPSCHRAGLSELKRWQDKYPHIEAQDAAA
jgi:hypothetical protein